MFGALKQACTFYTAFGGSWGEAASMKRPGRKGTPQDHPVDLHGDPQGGVDLGLGFRV